MALRYFATKAEHFLVSLSRRTRISCMVSLHRKIQRFSMDFTSICRCSFFFLQTERKMGIIAHLPSTRNQIYGMHTRIEEKPTHTRVNCKILSIIHSTLFYMVLCPAVNENTQWWTKAKEKTQSFALSLSLCLLSWPPHSTVAQSCHFVFSCFFFRCISYFWETDRSCVVLSWLFGMKRIRKSCENSNASKQIILPHVTRIQL